MKITILGYFGKGNFGDEVMLKNAISAYSLLPQISKIDVLRTDDAISTGSIVRNIDIRGFPGKMRLVLSFLTSLHVVWVGGTCFYDTEGIDGLKFIWRICKLCRVFRKQFHFVSVGVGAITTAEGKKLIEDIIESCKSISLRDSVSHEYVCRVVSDESKVAIAGDLFFSKLPEMESSGEKGDYATFSGHYMYLNDELVLAKCAALIKHLAINLDMEVVMIPFHAGDGGDGLFHDRLYKMIPVDVQMKVKKMQDGLCATKLSQAKLHIGFRLHSLALAEVLGTPYMGISYSPKVARFVEKFHPEIDCFILDVTSDSYIVDFEDILKNFKRNDDEIIREQALANQSLLRIFQ